MVKKFVKGTIKFVIKNKIIKRVQLKEDIDFIKGR